MIRCSSIAVALLLPFAFALWLGCSDDDKGVNKPVVPVEGELSDVRFQFAAEVFEPSIVTTTEISFYSSTFFLMGLPAGSAGRGAMASNSMFPSDMTGLTIKSVDTPTVSPQGWYVFHYDMMWVYDFTDTTNAVGVDSVRLLMGGSPVAWTGFNTAFDALECRDRAVWSDNRAQSGVSRHRIDLSVIDTMVPIHSLDISIADTIHTSREDDSGFCYAVLYKTGTGKGVLVSGIQTLSAICADSGTVSISTVVELDCTDHSQAGNSGVDGLWIQEGAYDNSHVLSCKLTHGNTYWNFADTCNSHFLSGNQ